MTIKPYFMLLLTSLTVTTGWSESSPATGASALPEVLIIGDSISIGYTPFVVELLKEEAQVKRHRGNARHTGVGLKSLDQWLGDTKWDVIHFNWGLHDLCYRHPESKVQGKRDKVNGTLTTSLADYEKNLNALVLRLKQTQARLVFATTTYVPPEEAGRKLGDDKKYNEVAVRVMQQHGVAINDLNTLSASFAPELFKKPGDVHYTKAGSEKLAQQVAAAIRQELAR